MPFTQHDQRQPAIKQISFGDKAQIDNTRWLCLGDDADQQVIPASRDYVSQLVTQAKDRSSAATQSGKMVIDQATALSSLYDTYNTMLSMYESSQKFAYDPFRGNTVAHGAIDGDPYLLIPCNKEFTTLRVISMTNEKLDLRQDATQWHSAPLPVGVIHTDLDIHVGPIQHITVSRAPDIPRQAMIVGVRAASRVLIIKITRSKNLTLSHELLYQLDAVRDNTFDTQWHPVDLCLSPYTFQHMAIMADDGQCMVVDLAVVQKADVLPTTFFYYGRMRDELLEEQGSTMSNSQRWKACVFGASPRSLVVASPKGLELVQFRDPQHPQSTLLYRCPLHTRLYTLASLGVRHSFQVVATSDESIILFDIRYPCQPVVAWDHLSPNPPPTCLQLVPDCKQPDHVHVFAWSTHDEYLIHGQYHFNGTIQHDAAGHPHVPHATYSRLYYLPLLRRHFRSLTKRHFIRSLGQHLVSSFLVDEDTGAKVTCMQAWQLLADGSVWTRLYLHDDRSVASGDKKWALQHRQSYFAIDDTDPAKVDYKTTVEIRRKHLTTAGSMQWLPRDIFQKVFQRGLKDVLRTDPPDYDTAKQWEPNANVVIGSLAHLFDEQSDLLPHMSMAALDRVESKLQLQGYYAPESRTTENNEDAWYPVPGQPDAYNKIRHELRTSHANNLDGITPAQKESRQTLIDACARDLYCHSRQYIHADERDTSGEASDASLMSTPQYIRVKSAFHASSSAKLLSRDWIPGRLSNLADQPLLTTKGLDQLPAVPLFYRFKRPRTRVQLHHLDDDQLNSSQDNDIDADSGAWHATSIPEFMLNDIGDNSGAASPIQQDIELEPSSFMNISTQPVAGMHAARQPPEPEAKKKKKRKKVVSGFM